MKLLLVVALAALLTFAFAKSNETPECQFCTLVVNGIKNAIKDREPTVIDGIKKNVCGILPEEFRGLCGVFVDEYGKQALDALLQGLEPNAVCRKIGACNSSFMRKYLTNEEAFKIYVKLASMPKPNGNDAQLCALCKFVIGEVEQYVNSSREELEHKLLKVCKVLPGQLEQLCDTFVLIYGDQIIDYIIENEKPDVACKQLHLCESNKQQEKVTPVVIEPKKEAAGAQCELCKYVLAFVEDYIGKNATEKKIEDALHKVCGKLPVLIRGPCNQLVQQYEKQIIEFVLHKYPPLAICQKIHLCPTKIELNDDNCGLCKFIVAQVESYLAQNATEHEIEELLINRVCNILPGDFKTQCTGLVKEYLPVIVHYVTENYKPEVICQKVGMCTKTNTISAAPKITPSH